VGEPALGEVVYLIVREAKPASTGVLFLGLSRTSYQGSPLPRGLGFLGAPGCTQLQDLAVAAPIGIAPNGFGGLPVQIPIDPSLRGLRVYSQVMVNDPGANAAGFVVSNGLVIHVGG
jgi:hypothetical protein